MGIGVVMAFMALAALTLPDPLWGIAPGLDSSWNIGLHLAAVNGLIFGRDIIFTYGPLGFLNFPLLISPVLWVISVAFIDIIHFAFFMSLAVFSLRSEERLLNAVILGFSAPAIEGLLLANAHPYELGAVLLFAFYFLTRDSKRNYTLVLAALAGIIFYVKVDIGLLSFLLTLAATTWVYFRDRRLTSLAPIATYAGFMFGFGVLLTGNIQNLASFIVGYEQIAVGFGNALSYDAYVTPWLILFPFLSLLILAIIIIAEVSSHTRLLLFLSIPFLFITYKEGFVREDIGHILIFLAGWSLVALLFQATISRKSRRIKIIALVLALILLGSGVEYWGIMIVSPGQPVDRASVMRNASTYFLRTYGPSRFHSISRTFDLAFFPGKATSAFRRTVSTTRLFYHLSNTTLSMLRGHTVDVLPWDVSLAYAYGLHWDPAPVFQSYSAYTPYLDELNARHYSNHDSPEFVLYRPISIDGRYPLFDEPLALMALTCNYQLISTDSNFLVLQRRTSSSCGRMDFISGQDATLGQQIQVPFNESTPIIARIFLDSNWLGTISGLAYKIPKVLINLEFANGQSQNFTLVVATAGDGLMLSPGFLSDTIPISTVQRISFFTAGPEFYNPVIRVEFYELHSAGNFDSHGGGSSFLECHGCYARSLLPCEISESHSVRLLREPRYRVA